MSVSVLPKLSLRNRSLPVFRSLGLFNGLMNSGWRKNRLLILGYHGISIEDEHLCLPELYMTADAFRSRMQLLKEMECNVLGLDEGLARLHEGSLPPRSVVITIDDGLMDFYLRAFPILKEFRYPATVYQSTYYCLKAWPVFDVIIS